MLLSSRRALVWVSLFLSAVLVLFYYSSIVDHCVKKTYEFEWSVKNFVDEGEVTNQICRRNTTYLVEELQLMQREVTSFLRTHFLNAKKRWKVFQPIFNAATIGFRHELNPFSVRSDESKYFLDFSNQNSSCNYVTLGVGGNWNAELSFRNRYPQCQFLGVDPIKRKNREIVNSEPNSRFVLAAVGDVQGNRDALVLANSKYFERKVPHRALTELLKTENRGRLIDFMTIDVEGAEFVLMKELHQKRAELPIICQFNLEIHYQESTYNVPWTEFERTLMEMFDEAHYVILYVGQTSFKFRRVFLFNVGDDECVQKFLC